MVTTKNFDSPVFFVGMPRSGTTVVFEPFSRHPALGWPTNYTERRPQSPWFNGLRRILDNRILCLAGRKGQYGRVLPGNRFLPHPGEAYQFWDHYTGREFSREYLLEVAADRETRNRVRTAVRKILQWQGRGRFAAKLTGPSRIRFLTSIFPNAQFVHVIRDGRAVVHSLLRVGFWREKGGYEAPFWHGGLPEESIAEWEASGRDPAVLAAVQWKAIVLLTRREAEALPEGRYTEVRYEEFIGAPHRELSRLNVFCSLPDSQEGHRYIDRTVALTDMNAKSRSVVDPVRHQVVVQALQPALTMLGYV